MIWHLRDRTLTPGKPNMVMGIVNVTPNSFSDGGQFLDPECAIAHGEQLVRQGAALLDVGGESSRPGSAPISTEAEIERVVPVIRGLAQRVSVPLSVDTCKAEVARKSLEAGAHVVNDITALAGDPNMGDVVRFFRAGVILMHMQGTPATMQDNPSYDDVTTEVADFLEARLQATAELGIARTQVVLDPGIGFGKTMEHNLELLARLDRLGKLGRPVCLGVSRKGFLGRLLDRPVEERLAASLAVACHALAHGTAQILRVHDVGQTRDAVSVIAALDARCIAQSRQEEIGY
jgi:dihydropteroate synthase